MGDKKRSGHPLKVSNYTTRRVLRAVRNEPFKSSVTLTAQVNTNVKEKDKISNTIFKRIALSYGLRAYRPCYKPKLTADHICKRLAFAKDYGDKTNRFWCNVLFTDETRLKRHAKDTRLRVRRPKNERHSTRFAAPTLKYGGDSIMFWGVFNWYGQGPLVLVEDTLIISIMQICF